MDAAALRALCEHALTYELYDRADIEFYPEWKALILDALMPALTSALQAGRTEPPPQDIDDEVRALMAEINQAATMGQRPIAECPSLFAFGIIKRALLRSREGDRPPEARTPTWQPIATAPKVGDVLLRGPGYIRTGYWNPRHECWTGDSVVPLPPPTHWAPLPRHEPTPAPEEPQR